MSAEISADCVIAGLFFCRLLLQQSARLRWSRLLCTAANGFHGRLVGHYSQCSGTACMWLSFCLTLIQWVKIAEQMCSSFRKDHTINRCPQMRTTALFISGVIWIERQQSQFIIRIQKSLIRHFAFFLCLDSELLFLETFEMQLTAFCWWHKGTYKASLVHLEMQETVAFNQTKKTQTSTVVLNTSMRSSVNYCIISISSLQLCETLAWERKPRKHNQQQLALSH